MRSRISAAIAFESMPGAIVLAARRIRPRFCMSARTACGDARVLHLDRDAAAVVQLRAVDLADRRGGERLLLELVEDVLERLLQVGLDDLAHVVERRLRRRVAQRGELGLEALLDLGRQRAGVHERHDLADLHRRALHLARARRRSARPPRSGASRRRRGGRPRRASGSRPSWRSCARPGRRPRRRPSRRGGRGRWGSRRCPSSSPRSEGYGAAVRAGDLSSANEHGRADRRRCGTGSARRARACGCSRAMRRCRSTRGSRCRGSRRRRRAR